MKFEEWDNFMVASFAKFMLLALHDKGCKYDDEEKLFTNIATATSILRDKINDKDFTKTIKEGAKLMREAHRDELRKREKDFGTQGMG